MLPVVVNSNDSETGYLSRGIADMLSARLERSGEIAIVRLEDGSTDQETAVEAASEVNASFVVFGSYTQFGDGASLDLRCAPVDGVREEGARRVFIQAGSPGEIIPKLDDLSDKVARYIERGAPPRAVAERGSKPAAAPPADDTVAELRERIRALEQAVFDADVEIAAPAESN